MKGELIHSRLQWLNEGGGGNHPDIFVGWRTGTTLTKLEGAITRLVDNPLLGEPVTIEEQGALLKKIKPNKSPGIYGITAEFLKVFWGKLKCFIAKSKNLVLERAFCQQPF